MAIKNLNLVLVNLSLAHAAKQVRDAVAGVLGHRMPTALSQGRPMSPGFATFDQTPAEPPCAIPAYEWSAKRVGRPAASLPGNPVRLHGPRERAVWVTSKRVGTAGRITVSGRGLSTWCERHHLTSGHDYPSHDRRDDRQSTRFGSAPFTEPRKVRRHRV
jgi:hypothetical protein